MKMTVAGQQFPHTGAGVASWYWAKPVWESSRFKWAPPFPYSFKVVCQKFPMPTFPPIFVGFSLEGFSRNARECANFPTCFFLIIFRFLSKNLLRNVTERAGFHTRLFERLFSSKQQSLGLTPPFWGPKWAQAPSGTDTLRFWCPRTAIFGQDPGSGCHCGRLWRGVCSMILT